MSYTLDPCRYFPYIVPMTTRHPVAIIPCSGQKATVAGPARDLYTGSMFRHTLAAAENLDDDVTVLVLSAEHGLVTLDTVLAPYERRMGQAGSVTVETVAAQAEALGITDGDVYAFLPQKYFSVLDQAMRQHDVYVADVYEADMGIGEQRRTNRCATEA